jgi:Na+/H+-translocating membrane pyrophosphatase
MVVYVIVMACGILALLYGWVTSRQVLAADAGSARMQEISAAVQEGARAYLNRQYTTIASGRTSSLSRTGPVKKMAASSIVATMVTT